jgi:hypothetical protein
MRRSRRRRMRIAAALFVVAYFSLFVCLFVFLLGETFWGGVVMVGAGRCDVVCGTKKKNSTRSYDVVVHACICHVGSSLLWPAAAVGSEEARRRPPRVEETSHDKKALFVSIGRRGLLSFFSLLISLSPLERKIIDIMLVDRGK